MANLVEASFDLFDRMVDTSRELLNWTSKGLGLLLEVVYLPSLTQSRMDWLESSLLSFFRADVTDSKSEDIRLLLGVPLAHSSMP